MITIDDNGGKPTVNARELHAFLEVGKDFSTWIKVQIERARLIEDRDYVLLTLKGEQTGRGGHNILEYHLGLDAADHICMLSQTEKGHRCRQYFIDYRNRQRLPYHLERYLINKAEVPWDHFSILCEMALMLMSPLETAGYRLPSNMVPDISGGLGFSKYLREVVGINPDGFPRFGHRYQDGRLVSARLYPIDLLGLFRRWFNTEWIPLHSIKYFQERDRKAIPYLCQSFGLALPAVKKVERIKYERPVGGNPYNRYATIEQDIRQIKNILRKIK